MMTIKTFHSLRNKQHNNSNDCDWNRRVGFPETGKGERERKLESSQRKKVKVIFFDRHLVWKFVWNDDQELTMK